MTTRPLTRDTRFLDLERVCCIGKLAGMAFGNQLREIGECYFGSRALLRVELRQSGVGAWQVQVVDREQNRRIDSSFDDEAAARQATETAYRYGRQFGRWNIQPASGYQPQGATVTPAGWEPDPLTS